MLLSLFNQRLMFATHNKRCHIPTNSTDDSCNAYYAFPPNSLQHISPCVARYALLKGVSCCSDTDNTCPTHTGNTYTRLVDYDPPSNASW